MGVKPENRVDVEVPHDFFVPSKSEGTKNPEGRKRMSKIAQYSKGGLTAREYANKAAVGERTAYRILNEAVERGKLRTEKREVDGRGENPTVYIVDIER